MSFGAKSAFAPEPGFTDIVYRLLAGTKLVAVAKTNGKPRPVGVKGVFDRIGMCCLLRKYKEGLAAHFGTQGEFGTGTGGGVPAPVLVLQTRPGEETRICPAMGGCMQRFQRNAAGSH